MNCSNVVKTIKEKWIYIFGYFYLFISIAIFLIGNVKLIISIPLTLVLLVAIIKAIRNSPVMSIQMTHHYKKIAVILVIIIAWVVFAGVGGFIWQNTWDHKFRNALFMDLVNFDWPVIQDDKTLCYYLGFWLPAAIVGKLFGIHAGYLFQTIWAVIGVAIAFGLICQYLKKIKIVNIIILIFFSGLDIFSFLIFSGLPLDIAWLSVFQGQHMELILNYFNSSSNTTLIFWLYNQIIPFWVGIMLLLNQKNSKSIVLIFALMMLFSPFPLVAVAPIIVYMVFRKQADDVSNKNIFNYIFTKIKFACTFENISAIFLVIIIGFYLKSNIAVGKIGLLEINLDVIIRYLCYIFFEFIVYLIFIYKRHRKDCFLNILIITTFLLPFITLGDGYNFAARTCIPLAFYIMLLIMKDLQDNNVSNKIKIGIVIILCLGSITPFSEMIRTTKSEIATIQYGLGTRSDSLSSIFDRDNNACYENFIGDRDSIFYRYFSK